MPDIVRQQGGVQLPSATVGGSTSESANLTDQDGAVAISLFAASETTLGGVTRQWTVYSPDGTDETSNIITANDDTASPTWAAFTSSSSRVGGIWRIEYALTDDNGTKTYKRYVQVGRLMFSMWWVAAVLVDWTTITTTKGNGDTYDAGNGTFDFVCDATHGSFVASGDANGLVVTRGASASTSSRFRMDTSDLVASLGINDDTPLCIVSEEIGYESTGARDTIGYLNGDESSRVLARYAQTSGPAYAVDENFNLNGAGLAFTGDDTPSAEVRWRGLMKLAPDTFRQWFDTDTSRTMPAFDSSESSHTVRPVVMGKDSAAPQGASDYDIATDRVFCGQCSESGKARKILSTSIWVVL